MRSRKSLFLLVAVSLAVIMVALSPTLSARPGGENSGIQEYDCGGSCHEIQGTAVLTMWASNISPTISSDVTVMVNVTGGEAQGKFGVMLVASKSPSPSSLPSNAGWTIVEDTSGPSANNYYEISSYAGSTSMVWKLKAPSTVGIYALFARAMHGDATATTPFFEDITDGIIFLVGSPSTSGGPVVVITSVTEGDTLKGTVDVDATVIPANKTIAYAVLKLGDTIIGNLTSAPYKWTINTDQFADGDYTLNVTVENSDGERGYKQLNVSISNAAISRELVDWVWTMVAGTIAILAWIGILIVVALMIRRRMVKVGGK